MMVLRSLVGVHEKFKRGPMLSLFAGATSGLSGNSLSPQYTILPGRPLASSLGQLRQKLDIAPWPRRVLNRPLIRDRAPKYKGKLVVRRNWSSTEKPQYRQRW